MKPTNDVNKLIKKLEIKASPELDRKINDDIFRAMAESAVGRSIWKMKLAVAAAIIISFGVGFLIGRQSRSTQSIAYSPDVNGYTSATSEYPTDGGGFWRQKAIAAAQPRPYSKSRFGEIGVLKAYKRYLKEKHYD